MDAVRPFVAGREDVDGLDLAGITAADVIGFVLTACPGLAPGLTAAVCACVGFACYSFPRNCGTARLARGRSPVDESWAQRGAVENHRGVAAVRMDLY